MLSLLLASFLAFLSYAQQTTATLVGTASDTTGAVLADVEVRVRNVETNIVRETRTDATGNYTIPFLPSGSYAVIAKSKGFRTQNVAAFPLEVGQTARVDLRMEIGEVSESIDVTADTTALQTETATVGGVIDGAKIIDLPLNGRNFVQLAQLIPGVLPGTPGSITVRRGRGSIGETSRSFGQTAISANGARDTNNRFYLDGVEFMDYDAFSYPFALSVDSLSEFKVETSTYSAEYGASPGGQVSIITRRGTNQFHGALWEFNRNDQLTQTYDAIGGTSVTSPRLNRNQFGGNLGGPVRLPKIYNGKDKTFFFFNWEAGRQVLGSAAARYGRVAPTAMRQGDFRGLTDSRGNPITLKDPLNVGIVNNQIPARLLSFQATTFLKFVPEANTSVGTSNLLISPLSGIGKQDNYTARADHNLTERDNVSFRYVINDTFEAGTPGLPNDQRDNNARTQNIAASYTRTFTPSLVNEFRFGWNNMTEAERFGTTNKPEWDIAGMMNLPLVSRRPIDYGPPSISISGPEGGFTVFNLQRQIGPRDRGNRVLDFNNILSMRQGAHSLRMGVDLLHRNFTFTQARTPRGEFQFDGTYTGSALADFMLGYVKRAQVNPDPTATDLVGLWQSYFVNDEWKVRPNLTLNLGLRYDYLQPFRDSQRRMLNIEMNGLFLTQIVDPSTSQFGPALIRSDKNNFSPRFGLAWRPGFVKDTVVRAGYGIYFNHIHPNAPFGMTEGAQVFSSYDVIGNLAGAPNVFFNDPFRTAVAPGKLLNAVPTYDQYYRDAYIQQWNLTMQTKTPGKVLLEAGYVASKGTALSVTLPALNRPVQAVDPRTPGLASLNARRPNPAITRGVNGDKPVGNSIYHSLQARADRRVGKGLTALASYTWSKCISGPSDIGADIGGGSYIGTMQDIYNHVNERSLCGFDVTQRFVQTVLFDLPFFQNSQGLTRTMLYGWQLSTITVAQSGFPGDISFGVDTTGTGVASRADSVLGQEPNLPGSQRTYQRWFNTDAFAQAAFGRYGTSPRTGAIRLPGLLNVDFSVNKDFHIGEKARVEFRTEFYNMFNRYNIDPGSVDRNIRSVNFGKVGGGIQGLTTRVIQLGAKLYF
ncbi:MAG: TonB-dependent receptor [Bryobacterales bacterium]|nr:TonB-dependent receptor [Bryobacterales bacterium]